MVDAMKNLCLGCSEEMLCPGDYRNLPTQLDDSNVDRTTVKIKRKHDGAELACSASVFQAAFCEGCAM